MSKKKKPARKTTTRKLIVAPVKKTTRTTTRRAVAPIRKLSLEDFRRRYPETAPNRYSVGPGEDPLTLVLDGGSTVTKGRGATLVVEDAGRIGKFRVELRSE